MTLREYESKYRRIPGNNFAVACYDQNRIEELQAARRAYETQRPDDDDMLRAYAYDDMDTWGIEEPEEWYDAICAALQEREPA